MGRSETPLLVILGALFLAMAGWLGLSAWENLTDPIRSTLAVPVTVEETVELEGVLLREEVTVATHLPCCTLFARAGERCAAGSVLGVAAVDAAALRSARLLEENRQLLTLAERGEDAGAVYADALHRGDMATAAAAVTVMAREERVALLEADTALLAFRLAGKTESLLAPVSGLFFPWVDGYEHLSPARLTELTAEGLEALLLEEPVPVTGACGRLVAGPCWYYAAKLGGEEAQRLRVGDAVLLTLAGGCPPVEAEILSVSAPAGESCAVVFRCDTMLRECAGLRFSAATAVTGRYQGLQLPAEAVRQDEAGSFVYLAAGLTAERVDVEILYETNGSLLVTGSGLHPGSEILIGGSRLYDGCLLR